MIKLIAASVILVFALGVGKVYAQTQTPTDPPTQTPTETPTMPPWVYSTIAPLTGTPEGQLTRFDYVTSAADVHIANLLTALLYSIWGMFIIFLLLHLRGKR
jgi:hypothetical protein